ncbi:dipeptidase [Kribbella sp. NBC_01484]|uniref:dipeptidase n=1 Tax=Kribbella sp. NBC_01484 TaxID=2903579 RepID=UPI002E3222ED|nr:membrane dipeptidase [Kribbella sp. NBC_01484]
MTEQFGTFDFGLDEAQEERAARLHRECVIVDVLFQGPVGYRVFDDEMNKELQARLKETHDTLGTFSYGLEAPIRRAFAGRMDEVKDHWDASGITCGNRQVEMSDVRHIRERSFAFVQKQFDYFPWLTKALTAGDIRRAHETGTHAGLMSSQVMLGPWRDLDALAWAHDSGLRMCQLTYNNMTAVGVGSTERTDAGLSAFGVDSVKAMNELGIIVDTGHVGRMTTLDACEVSEAPVVASHTAAQGVFNHARGKSDEELRALAATGGLIGIVTVPFFLGAGPSVTINAMLDHVEYVADVAGVDHVAIGTDWPMQLPQWMLSDLLQPIFAETGFRPEDKLVATQQLAGFDDYRDFPNITRGLVGRGWSDEDIAKVLGENFVRVMGAVCG